MEYPILRIIKMNTQKQLRNQSYLAGGYKPRGDIYCPSCNKVCANLEVFIKHALKRHCRIYHSTPKGDNYEMLL